VLAQEEARLLNHGFIGTEHLLLGLIAERNGVAAKALGRLGITLDRARAKVEETLGLSGMAPTGSPPFTPRAKKVMELSLREALDLGHNYISTEHMLLGIVQEGEGVACQVLVSLGADLTRVRQQVIELLSGYKGKASTEPSTESGPWERWTSRSPGSVLRRRAPAEFVACSFCGRQPPASGRIIRGADAFICEHCIRQWHGVLDQPAVTEHAPTASIVVLGTDVVPGEQPENPDAARAEITAAFVSHETLGDDGQSLPMVEKGGNLGPTLVASQERHRGLSEGKSVSWSVDEIVFTDPEHAAVWFTFNLDNVPMLARHRGDAVMVEGQWKMARSTFCELMRMAGVECPPPPG